MSTGRTLVALALAYAIVGIVAGVMQIGPQHQRAVDLVLNITTVIAIYAWCRSDLLRRTHVPPRRWALWAALLSPIVLPLYFLRTRSPAGAAWSLAKAVGGYVGLTLIFIAFATVAGLAAASR